MVVFTIREFSFLLELKEHCLLGRFVPFTLSEGLGILRLSVTMESEIAGIKRQVGILVLIIIFRASPP